MRRFGDFDPDKDADVAAFHICNERVERCCTFVKIVHVSNLAHEMLVGRLFTSANHHPTLVNPDFPLEMEFFPKF